MREFNIITALYFCLSVRDEDSATFENVKRILKKLSKDQMETEKLIPYRD